MTTCKVLIPLDGSALSRQIIPHVRRFLRPADCELILLRVTDPPAGRTALPPRPVSMSWTEPLYDSIQDIELSQHPLYASQSWQNVWATTESDMLEDVRLLREAGYAVSVLVRFGDPAREIVEVVERENVDLVAMATHGRTGLNRLLLGSVMEDALRNFATPLLIVRPFEHVRNGGEM